MPTPSTPAPPSTLKPLPPTAAPHAYRCGAIADVELTRFAGVLLRELLECDGTRYDAVYVAYAESGIQPLPAMQCEDRHYDARVEGVNRIADALAEAIFADRGIHEALISIASAVLCRLTIPAPDGHLTLAELRDFAACCGRDEEEHIAEYDVYAALHAHLGACAMCDVRMRLMRAKAPPGNGAPRTPRP